MSNQIDVNVYKESEFCGQANRRPRRSCPDGTTGVVYQGNVYPIYDDSQLGLHIVLDGDFFLKDDCPTLFNYQKSIWRVGKNVVDSDDFYIEKNRFGVYFVFNGSDECFEGVEEFCEESNHELPYLGSGASYRPADNGVQYDWFVRFDATGVEKSIVENLTPFLNYAEFAGLNQGEISAPNSEQKVTDLEEQLLNLEFSLAEANDRLDDKTKCLSDERVTRAEFENEIRNLRLVLKTSRQRDENESESIRDYEQVLDEIGLENEKLKIESENRKAHNEALIIENTILEQKLERASNSNGSRSLKKKIKDLCTAYLGRLPRLIYSDDFIEVMLNSFADYSHLFKLLESLTNKENIEIVRIYGRGPKDPLWEVKIHIRTGIAGIADMGRLYFKRNGTNDELEVFLHIKRDGTHQTRFIEAIP